MTWWRATVGWLCLMVASLSLGSGCGTSTSGALARAPEYVPAEIQPGLGQSIVSKSVLDTDNRYVAALRVDGGQGMCSGVLVAPRVVLTAGHCVCVQREAGPEARAARTVIDKTTCTRTATVRAVIYGSEGTPKEQILTGSVRPHERLKVLYNGEDKEVASDADLAVIFLKESPKGVKPIRLATARIPYAQLVTLVGYGEAKLKGGLQGSRRFGFNEVASIAEDGVTFLVGKPIQVRRPYKPKDLLLVREEASYSLEGDSGGPCVVERKGALELVGIAKTHYGSHELVQFSEYTSTYFYLEWLRREIANAERLGAD